MRERRLSSFLVPSLSRLMEAYAAYGSAEAHSVSEYVFRPHRAALTSVLGHFHRCPINSRCESGKVPIKTKLGIEFHLRKWKSD